MLAKYRKRTHSASKNVDFTVNKVSKRKNEKFYITRENP